MAIYIKYFQNMVDYQQFLNTADFVKPNVSSVEETAQAFYHSVNKSLFLAKAGDVVLYDKVNKTKVAVAQNALNATDYPSSQFAPLGVVVVPASHDVYGTGECGIVSINAMSYEHPNTGFSNEKIHWGGSGYDITTLSNYNQLPLIDSALLNNAIVGIDDDAAYLPSTRFTEVKPVAGIGLDAMAGYFNGEYSVEFQTVPSPYLENGKRNPSYFTKDVELNALADFNGKENTKLILEQATAQAGWKSDATITNKNTTGYYPAACSCWRYNTDGTSQGDWYLPAVGELGYLMARFNEVQNALQTVKDVYNVGYTLQEDKSMWSSTEHDGLAVRYIDLEDGRSGRTNKMNLLYARAFLRA